MKKLLGCVLILSVFACQNPEEQATTITDTNATYNENDVTNTPPGATTPDTSRTDAITAPGAAIDTTKRP